MSLGFSSASDSRCDLWLFEVSPNLKEPFFSKSRSKDLLALISFLLDKEQSLALMRFNAITFFLTYFSL